MFFIVGNNIVLQSKNNKFSYGNGHFKEKKIQENNVSIMFFGAVVG